MTKHYYLILLGALDFSWDGSIPGIWNLTWLNFNTFSRVRIEVNLVPYEIITTAYPQIDSCNVIYLVPYGSCFFF